MVTLECEANQSEVVSAGFDWLTITEVEAECTTLMYQHANEAKRELVKSGHFTADWSAMGYRGWSLGPLRYGERGPNEAILIVSGDFCREFAFRPWIRPERITRADIQVTLRCDKPQPELATTAYRHLAAAEEGKQRKRFLNLITSETGSTLYVGKRDANVSLRFYDKSLDYGEKELGSIWRYEVQYRRSHAKTAGERLLSTAEPNRHVLGLVAAEFEKRGVLVRFGAKSEITAIAIGRTVTTQVGQLKWLEKCVAPVVSQLCLIGYEEAVINSLSLRGIINNIRKEV